jgi:hypothetical protein
MEHSIVLQARSSRALTSSGDRVLAGLLLAGFLA